MGTSCHVVTVDLDSHHISKGTEGVMEDLLINLGIKIAYEEVGSYVLTLLVLRCLVDFEGSSIQLDHVQDLDAVVSVLFTPELHKSVALVLVGDLVSRHVHIDHRPSLDKQLPQQLLIDTRLEVADVDSGVLVAFVDRSEEGVRHRFNV
jgi:hypothetical protein